MKKGLGLLLLLFSLLLLTGFSANAMDAEMANKFEVLSVKTRQALELSTEEINLLVKECDQLLEQTASLEGSEKKIISKRVKRMCELFRYVLSKREAEAGVKQ